MIKIKFIAVFFIFSKFAYGMLDEDLISKKTNQIFHYNQNDQIGTLKEFSNCLLENEEKLEVRDLNDFYRIRGIPSACCKALGSKLISNDLLNFIEGLDITDCRINAFFIQDGIIDPHNHPFQFLSYIVSGGYTQTIFSKENDNLGMKNKNYFYTEHSRIDTVTDIIKELGIVKLTKLYQESFIKKDFAFFDNTKTIHRIDSFIPDTLTVNFLSKVGDKEIDVFISHETPERKVLSKADTQIPVAEGLALNVINKCIKILNAN